MESVKLSPEQERALGVFMSNYSSFYQATIIPVDDLTVDNVTIQNSVMYVVGRIGRKTLPHDPDWIWNQTKSKVTVNFAPREQVILAKLNPRKHSKSSSDSQHPSYKLWDCEIISDRTQGAQIHFLWVEKGKANAWSSPPLVKSPSSEKSEPPSIEITPSPTPTPASNTVVSPISTSFDEIDIRDLSFLKDFIEPQLASQFGWLDNLPSNTPKPDVNGNGNSRHSW